MDTLWAGGETADPRLDPPTGVDETESDVRRDTTETRARRADGER
jgi:hypothetical protein